MVELKEDLRRALDPMALAETAGMDPEPWQIEALRSDAPRQLYNAARQSGKSSVAAVVAMHTALYRADSLVLMVSRTLDHSGELFRKALKVYKDAGRPVKAASETALSLTLENGSRIVSRPGKDDVSVRGYSADLLIVDGAARVPGDLYSAALPVLAKTGGRLIALSTPFGNRGWWWEAWEKGNGWERFEVTAHDLPPDWYLPTTEEFLGEEKRRMGEWWFRQEYFCEALDAQTQAFTRQEVEAAFEEEVEEWAL